MTHLIAFAFGALAVALVLSATSRRPRGGVWMPSAPTKRPTTPAPPRKG